MKNLILIGGGGHCKSVIDTILEGGDYRIVGILDLPEKVGENILGIEIIGTDDMMDHYFKQGIDQAFITMGSIGDIRLRRNLYEHASALGFKFPNIIDKTAVVSQNSILGQGNFVGKGAIINAGARIGNQCIINTGAIIDHDCQLADFVHIAPGASLSGQVSIGENTHIGTNSSLIQNISIGRDSILGAGSVVIKDIGDNQIFAGNPAKSIK